MKIGIIAEAASDVDVVETLIRRHFPDRRVGVKSRRAAGCGKLRRKLSAWVPQLFDSGVDAVIVVHDLDQSLPDKLRSELERSVHVSIQPRTLIVIPVREIEAWLMSDGNAIARVFRSSKSVPAPSNPELLVDAKRALVALVRKHCARDYIPTVHNGKLAQELALKRIARLPSFKPLPAFISAAMG